MKWIFNTIFVFTILTCYGQRLVLDAPMLLNRATSVHTAKSNDGTKAYIFSQRKSYEVLIVSPSYTIAGNYRIATSLSNKKSVIAGALLSSDILSIYTYNYSSGSLSCLKLHIKTGQHSMHNVFTMEKNFKVLKFIESENYFYVLSCPEYKNTIRVSVCRENKVLENIEFDIAYPALYAKLSSGSLSLVGRSNEPLSIEQVKYDIENNVKSTYFNKKIYLIGQSLILTFDEPAITHIIMLNLEQKTSTYRKVNFSLDNKELTVKQGNSFFFSNLIFRATLNEEQLNISIIDADSMRLLKKYNIYKEGNIDIMNGFVIQNSNDDNERVIKKTSQYFKKLMSGKLAIAVNAVGDTSYVMEVGAYEEIYYRAPSSNFYPYSPAVSFGIGFGAPYMGMGFASPFYYDPFFYPGFPGYYSPYNTSNYKSVSATYFQSLLSSYDLSHREGRIGVSMRERLSDYQEKVLKKTQPDLFSLVADQNVVLMGYYSKSSRMYKLVEFLK